MAIVRAMYQSDAFGHVLQTRYVWELTSLDPDPQRGFVARGFLRETWGEHHAPVGTLLQLGDLKMRVIGTNILRDAYEVELESLHARWSAIEHPLRDAVDMFYRRSILTLAVWGLAEYDIGTIPSWRNVYAFRRLAEFWRKWVMLDE